MARFTKDDMVFKPYKVCGEIDGYQCLMETKKGTISVRYEGCGLFTNKDGIYEVWYPDRDCPDGYQTADDIWGYINNQ